MSSTEQSSGSLLNSLLTSCLALFNMLPELSIAFVRKYFDGSVAWPFAASTLALVQHPR